MQRYKRLKTELIKLPNDTLVSNIDVIYPPRYIESMQEYKFTIVHAGIGEGGENEYTCIYKKTKEEIEKAYNEITSKFEII